VSFLAISFAGLVLVGFVGVSTGSSSVPAIIEHP
jgi:hypothetical protein